MTAHVHILNDGYTRIASDVRVASTVSLVVDGNALIVIDPGMVASRQALVDRLSELGTVPEDVTDVVLSHHHPDHTMNAGHFPNARVHDHWAWYRDDLWVDRRAEGFVVSDSVHLIETPGHTPQDITTVVESNTGTVVFTHLWWTESEPPEDPYATDPVALHANRRRVLALPRLAQIVPGHGPAFVPSDATPR